MYECHVDMQLKGYKPEDIFPFRRVVVSGIGAVVDFEKGGGQRCRRQSKSSHVITIKITNLRRINHVKGKCRYCYIQYSQ